MHKTSKAAMAIKDRYPASRSKGRGTELVQSLATMMMMPNKKNGAIALPISHVAMEAS
jgi:hypothetical protein